MADAGIGVVRWLARVATWTFYRAERRGPPLPPGPLLLVANHANALLDPAVVWATAGRDVRFLAKAPLFDVPVFGGMLRAAGAIPVYRAIDVADMSRNAEMFSAVLAGLAAGDAICLFPEGTSHSTGRLAPLRTGAARIALEAAADGIDVAIVPIGLNFDRKSAFRSRATAVFGQAFGVDHGSTRIDRPRITAQAGQPRINTDHHGSSSAADYKEAVRALTDRIAQAMRALLIEADPVADAAAIQRLDRLYLSARPEAQSIDRVERRRLIAAGLARLRSDDPAWYAEISDRVRTYDARLARFGLRDRDLDGPISFAAAARFAVREGVIAIALAPLVLAGFAIFLVPYLVTDWIASRSSHLDEEATTKVIAGGFVYGLWIALIGWLAWRMLGLGGAVVVLALLPAAAFASLAAIERESAVLAAVRGYLAVSRASPRTRASLGRTRNEIADVLEEVRQWLAKKTESAETN